jgi:predicted nucleotidyltransferase
LARFIERLHPVNANAEYLYRVESAVLFGSMLTETERLGDVDLAVELSSKATGEKAFDRWCDRRRDAALEAGQRFKSDFDWVVWPKAEVYRALRGRTRTLSIQEWDQIKKMADVRYRIV